MSRSGNRSKTTSKKYVNQSNRIPNAKTMYKNPRIQESYWGS